MAVLLGAKRQSDGLYGTDFGLVPDSASDQTAALQAFFDALTSGTSRVRRKGILEPGLYKKSGELVINNTDGHKPVYIWGGGGNPSSDAPTVIQDTADAGAGKYSVRQAGTIGYCDVRGINLIGSLSPVAKGSTGWAMGGWKFVTRSWIEDIGAAGYDAGFALWGDHIAVTNLNVQGNVKGLDVPANIPTQGDNRFYGKLQAGGNARAGVAVAKSSSLAGVTFEALETSAQPIGIWRYDDGTGTSSPNWLAGIKIKDWSTEYIGTGVVVDDVGDGSGITDMTVNHGTDNWAFGVVGNEWPGKTKRATWYNSGPISNVLFVEAMPRMEPTIGPAIKAAGITRVRCDRPAEEAMTGITSGGRMFENTGGSSGLRGSYVGSASADGSSLMNAYPLVGTVARGELLTNSGQWSATKWSGSGRVIGVALHDQTGGTIHSARHGQWGVSVLNSSGSTVAADALLVPHSSGGVAALTGLPAYTITNALTDRGYDANATTVEELADVLATLIADLQARGMIAPQVIGRMIASTANGALGAAELF